MTRKKKKDPPDPAADPPETPPPSVNDLFETPEDSGINGGDLFSVKPERVASLRERGIDARIAKVRLFRYENGKRRRIPGDWPIEQVSISWILSQFGPGIYLAQALNEANVILTSEQTFISNDELNQGEAGGAFSMPSAPGGMPMPKSGGSFEQQMLWWMLSQQMNVQKNDPMREATAGLVKMMAANQQIASQQAQQMQQFMQMQLSIMQQGSAPAEKERGQLLKMLFESMKGPQGASPSVNDAIGMLQFGMQMADQIRGAKDGDDDLEKWAKLLTPMIDQMGQPLALTFANIFLPKDRADQVMKLAEKETQARVAEAEAAIKAAPIDAEGAEVMG